MGASKISSERVEKLIESAAAGCTKGDCARAASITRTTLENWLADGREEARLGKNTLKARLHREFRMTAARMRQRALEKLYNADDWRATAEWLRRTSREYPNYDRIAEAEALAPNQELLDLIRDIREKD